MPGYAYTCRCGADGFAVWDRDSVPRWLECLTCGGLMRRDYRSVQIGVQATPVGRNPEALPVGLSKGWSYEKGVVGEHRPGGGFVPYLGGPDGELVSQKLWDDRGSTEKKRIQRERAAAKARDLAASPTP